MGGYGSGRWGAHIKAQTVEMAGARLPLDRDMAATIRRGGRYRVTWQRKPSQAGALGALLGNLQARVYCWEYEVVEGGQAIIIEHGEPGRPAREHVAVARRALRYGARLFWVCPGCNRRAAILYRRWGRFRCRHCHGLTYRSAQEADKRVYALVRQIHDAPALAALPTGDTLADLSHAFLMLKAVDIAMKRNKRELRKLGVRTDF
jgi:hypothetical protein